MYSKKELVVEKWLSPKVQEQLVKEVKTHIKSEKRERVLRNPNSNIDYGYSFPGVTNTKQACLEEVRHFYEKNGQRPHVADLGAGFGTMTWKLLAAGARVDAFEVQKPTAKELMTRIYSMSSKFWNGDELKKILQVYDDNAITTLDNPKFEDQYDFIWTAHMIHFLTPDEIKKLGQLFQRILKPNGQIFVEVNTIETFQSYDREHLIASTYNKAKDKGIDFPGFLLINTTTLINKGINNVSSPVIVSVLDQEEMKKHAIPIKTNAYGVGHLGPVNRDKEKELHILREKSSNYHCEFNRFYQQVSLLDDANAKKLFGKLGFECVSYYFSPDHSISQKSTLDSEISYALALFLKKSPELILQLKESGIKREEKPLRLSSCSLFNISPHNQLILDAEIHCKGKSQYDSFMKAIQEKEYALALRKSCAAGSLALVKTLLTYKTSLNIDINQPSTSNGWNALDWARQATKVDSLVREDIEAALLDKGAKSALDNTLSMK